MVKSQPLVTITLLKSILLYQTLRYLHHPLLPRCPQASQSIRQLPPTTPHMSSLPKLGHRGLPIHLRALLLTQNGEENSKDVF